MQQHAAAKGAICRKVDSKSSFSIFVRICSTNRAPRGVHCICCFLTKCFTHQLVHRRLREGRAADPDRVLNEDWEDTFRGWYPDFRPKLENEIKQAA
jgi:hypothetical protein